MTIKVVYQYTTANTKLMLLKIYNAVYHLSNVLQ